MTRTTSVLVVDDSATMRAYHRDLLTAAGFAVREAANGYEALEEIVRERVDVLLVDVNMPVMDGLTLVEHVRRPDSPVATAVVVMVSSERAPTDVHEARRRGADAYLVKPVSPESLVRAVRALLGSRAPVAAVAEDVAP